MTHHDLDRHLRCRTLPAPRVLNDVPHALRCLVPLYTNAMNTERWGVEEDWLDMLLAKGSTCKIWSLSSPKRNTRPTKTTFMHSNWMSSNTGANIADACACLRKRFWDPRQVWRQASEHCARTLFSGGDPLLTIPPPATATPLKKDNVARLWSAMFFCATAACASNLARFSAFPARALALCSHERCSYLRRSPHRCAISTSCSMSGSAASAGKASPIPAVDVATLSAPLPPIATNWSNCCSSMNAQAGNKPRGGNTVLDTCFNACLLLSLT